LSTSNVVAFVSFSFNHFVFNPFNDVENIYTLPNKHDDNTIEL
jgi:hypothetical protein